MLTVHELKGLGEHQLTKARPFHNLCQTLAEHFYPEKADFIVERSIGDELADNLVSSYPILVRRDLGNSYASMLRDGDWFSVGVNGEPDRDGLSWLQWSSSRLRKYMYHRSAAFMRATKEADHDFATFGQAVLSVERNQLGNGLLYRSWHMKDCAWWDGVTGGVDGVVRRWSPTRRQAIDYFGEDKLHADVLKDAEKKPFGTVEFYHFDISAAMYGSEEIAERFDRVLIWIDSKHDTLVEAVGSRHRYYIVPRFQTVSSSQYAYSPATVAGLPDARTIQAMTHTLLEAGERYTRPPLIAQAEVVRGDVDLSSDGITYLDPAYDEKLGEGLRPLLQDRGGFPIGLELRSSVMEVLASAFYLNTLKLPEVTREMTAYEVQERMKQYRRANLPLFAPVEAEYSAPVCELSFDIAMENGFFGSPHDVPESLRGQEIEFKFESPLSQATEEKKAAQFAQVTQLLAEAVQYDSAIAVNIDFDSALRDAIEGVGAPAKWLRSVEEVMKGRQAAEIQQAMASIAEAQQGAA